MEQKKHLDIELEKSTNKTYKTGRATQRSLDSQMTNARAKKGLEKVQEKEKKKRSHTFIHLNQTYRQSSTVNRPLFPFSSHTLPSLSVPLSLSSGVGRRHPTQPKHTTRLALSFSSLLLCCFFPFVSIYLGPLLPSEWPSDRSFLQSTRKSCSQVLRPPQTHKQTNNLMPLEPHSLARSGSVGSVINAASLNSSQQAHRRKEMRCGETPSSLG
mmetsp:Transcript_13440/g.26604  ORF Transcript_13440/g.26604 Transcript_13440/m.26604 type:complete len:213 (-) Transcript_13440:476-1114(-)